MKSNRLKTINKFKELVPANKLAFKYINDGVNITAEEVNNVLAFSGLNITQETLNILLSYPRLEFFNLDLNTINSNRFKDNLGTTKDKVPGVYIWTHISTGDKYVGSSTQLARRLNGYFKDTHADAGKLIPLIKKEGLSVFNLQVIVLKDNYVVNQELLLEQYFLLHTEFNLNTLRVVNTVLGARSKALYMYTKDFSELIYSSDIQEDFIFKLKIHHTSFSKCLSTGVPYLDKYVFSNVPVSGAINKNMSISEVQTLLGKDRLEINLSKRRSNQVLIRNVNNVNDTKLFNSIKDCIAYLNTIAPSSRTTLLRHIESKTPYHNYICEWYGDKVSSFKHKAMQVNITNINTSEVETFSSFRQAALSLSTTGPTVKTFADNGKLFQGVYMITYVNSEFVE